MELKIVQWALNNGYSHEHFVTTAGKNEVMDAYKAAHGKGKKKARNTATVEVALPDGETVSLGEMDNRKKTIQGAVLAYLVANGHGFDKEDLLRTKIRATVIVEQTSEFSALAES